MQSNIVVSVCVVTYKQEDYIEQCLESIVRQKTNFRFELIIGEDCSPDGTSNIVRKFSEKYPEIVTPIIRTRNVGGHRNFIDVFERAKGKYIAYCEGDDYWIDPLKLQKQYDALERQPEIDLCFHPAKEYRNEKFHGVINSYYREETVVPVEKVIEGRGGYMPTASLMIRMSAIYPFPDWFIDKAPVGDSFIQALGSMRGGALFLPKPMSSYRRYSEGSVTQKGKSGTLSSKVLIDKALNYLYCYKQLPSQKSMPSIELACCRQLIEVLGHSIRLGDRVAAKETAYLIRANFGQDLTLQLKIIIWSVAFHPLFLFARGVLKLRDMAG
ncbi:MAG: hypothetical protein C9356_12740 [Oleiphilus sp.]|nr:MAG: hypothetical protein C9356_12740 [Oleiphilus sp.]